MLQVTYIPVINEDFATQLQQEAKRIDPKAKVHGQYPGPQGAVEWALPAVVAFTLGGIASGILSEMSKDIYGGLKQLATDAYREAEKNPYEWEGVRKEPTLNDPGADISAEAQAPTASDTAKTSPPLKLTLHIEGWDGRLSFVFSRGFTPEQVVEAYDEIGGTVQTILQYSTLLYTQLHSKRSRPELYQGTMPDDIWEEKLEREIHEAALLLHGVFVFDEKNKVWGRAH